MKKDKFDLTTNCGKLPEKFNLKDKMFICHKSFKYDYEKKIVAEEKDIKELQRRLIEFIKINSSVSRKYIYFTPTNLIDKVNELFGFSGGEE